MRSLSSDVARPAFLWAVLFCLFRAVAGLAAEDVFISEFMAVNNSTLADEDGDFSDWIEIHNSGAMPVNLNGWFLTDKLSQLTERRFPATNLPPNGYLVVFASGKDRRVPGAPLHTNFKLSSSGEYLALVKPDGTNVASAFAPQFPAQVGGVSYGVPVQAMVTTLVASGAMAQVLVPWDASLGSAWQMPGFDDSTWSSVPTGVGFELGGQAAFTPELLADSVAEFSGTQGQDNWFYGYWNKQFDADGVYADADFVPFPNNYWTGAVWDWPGTPLAMLTAQGGSPSANDGTLFLPDLWAVRRYVNDYDGPVTITGTLGQSSGWVYVTATGVNLNTLLYIYQTGAGQGYIDDVKLVAGSVPEAGANLVVNGDFESGSLSPWTVSPNLAGSSISTSVAHSGSRSLHIVSAAAGTTQTSAIWQNVSAAALNQTYTLSYWYLPAPNSSPLVVRTSGAWISTTVDGVIGRIFVDGTQVLQQAVFGTNVDFSFTVRAHLGSKIDFAIDAGPASLDYGDTTTFTASIASAHPAFTTVADSAADWSVTGKQGEKNWFYGYYNRTTDPDKTYQPTDFIAFPHDPGPQ